MPYYFVVYLLRSPDFVTLAVPVLNKLDYNKVVGFLRFGHIPYSRKFSGGGGAKFRYFRGPV